MFGFLLASFFILLGIVSSQTVSIQYVSAYYSQRDCASTCQAIYPNYPPDLIAEYLSCATDPIENSCFCSVDMQSNAESHIQSCVQNLCQNTLDASIAVSIYHAYCTSAGFVKAGITGTPTSLLYTLATITVTMVETVTVRSGQMRLGSPFGALVELVDLR